MDLFGQSIAPCAVLFLALALLLALLFEFVNGFHDTANAVATVIYTRSMAPVPAVLWSGCWNLIGVLASGGGVAFAIVSLLPVKFVLNVGSDAGFAMVFSLLLSAIIWNLGTWYLGLPASSSHTLIGSIMGVGLANAVIHGGTLVESLNWSQVHSIFLALIFSPIIGFLGSALLLLSLNLLIKKPELFKAPGATGEPPLWIRALLVLTCTGVSFAHGSNDGQKGMGLIMLIVIGVLPGAFALQLGTSSRSLAHLTESSHTVSAQCRAHSPGVVMSQNQASTELASFLGTSGTANNSTFVAVATKTDDIAMRVGAVSSLRRLSNPDRKLVRKEMYLVADSIAKLDKEKKFSDATQDNDALAYQRSLDATTKFIPVWVKVAVAFALGLGTVIGWKRIVVTVGEKIGKQHLSYADGVSAGLTAALAISLATFYSLPVSTTHVLSSGVAGTMFANKSGLQATTLRNIGLAWVLTLPVCVLLGAGIFSAALYFVLHVLHGN